MTVEEKAKELSEKTSKKVHGFELYIPEKDSNIELYVSEPSLDIKLQCMDLSIQGRTMYASKLIFEGILKEESSPEFGLDEMFQPKNEKAYIGALMKCQTLVQYYGEVVKKN